jgi:hypothetical protein
LWKPTEALKCKRSGVTLEDARKQVQKLNLSVIRLFSSRTSSV